MSQEKARSTVLIDNERVRVTEWRFAPRAATGYHRHEYDYVVVPLTTGKLLLKALRRRPRSRVDPGRPLFSECRGRTRCD